MLRILFMRSKTIAAIIFSCLLLTKRVISAQALSGSMTLDTGLNSVPDNLYALATVCNDYWGRDNASGPSTWEQWHIAEGNWFKVAVSKSGTVKCWGSNDRGLCNITPGLAGITAVEEGDDFTISLLSNGTVIA